MKLDLKDTKISKIYKSLKIYERHRHRYEVNINFREAFKARMIFSGLSPDNKLPETIEPNNHLWFIGVQFHLVKSRPFTILYSLLLKSKVHLKNDKSKSKMLKFRNCK